MGKLRDEKEAELRVVEEVTHSEEVVRLDGGDSTTLETISRIEVAAPQEKPTLLASEVTEIERRSHEPDIDVIIEDTKESEDLEDGWQEGRQRGPVPYGWFVLIFVFVVLAVGWSLGWFSGAAEDAGSADLARLESVERLEEEELEVREATLQVERVEMHVKRYASAASIEELLPLVRNPGRVAPLMRAWYERHPFERHRFGRMLLFQPLALDSKNFFIVRYEIEDSSVVKTVLVEDLGEKGVFTDWETDVCYQPISWDRYVEERPVGPTAFRVWMEPDRGGLYSHEFRDEDKWRAIKLTALGSEEFLIGYAERGTAREEALLVLMEDNGFQKVAVVMELEVPEDVQSLRGVVINKLISERWLVE